MSAKLLFLSAVGAVVCCLPLLQISEDIPVNYFSALIEISEYFPIFLACTIAVCISPAIHLCSDQYRRKYVVYLYLTERMFCIIGILAPAVGYYCIRTNLNPHKIGSTIFTLMMSQSVLFLGSLLSVTVKNSASSVWSEYGLFPILITFSLNRAFLSWKFVNKVHHKAIDICGVVSGAVSILYFILRFKMSGIASSSTAIKTALYQTLSYLLDYLIIYLSPQTQSYGQILFCLIACTFALALIALCMVDRLALIQIVQCEEDAKGSSSRDSLLQYLGYELRSCLNIAYMGMNAIEIGAKKPARPQSAGNNHAGAQGTPSGLKASFTTGTGFDSAESKNIIQQMQDAVKKAVGVLDRLSDSRRLQQRAVNLAYSAERPVALVRECLRTYELKALRSVVSFEIVPGAVTEDDAAILQNYYLVVDAFKVGQTLRKLVANALKYTSSGGSVAVVLTVKESSAWGQSQRLLALNPGDSIAESNGGIHLVLSSSAQAFSSCALCIEVKDTGIGMEASVLEGIFDGLKSFDLRRRIAGRGSGVGLAVAKGIIGLHGGKITAVSAGTEKGSTFTVELPLFTPEEVAGLQLAVSTASSQQPSNLLSWLLPGMRLARVQPLALPRPITGSNSLAGGSEVAHQDDSASVDVHPNDSILPLPLSVRSPEPVLLSSAADRSGRLGNVGDAVGNRAGSGPATRVPNWRMVDGDDTGSFSFRFSCNGKNNSLMGPVTGSVGTASFGSNRPSRDTYISNAVAAAAVAAGVAPRGMLDLAGKHVLIVDDSVPTRKICCTWFRKFGAMCGEATNGSQALRMVEMSIASGDLYDVVLIDNVMPVMSGSEACSKMRQAGFTNPIIGMTGYASEEDFAHFLQQGATQVFLKPVDGEELHAVLMNLQHENSNSNRSEMNESAACVGGPVSRNSGGGSSVGVFGAAGTGVHGRTGSVLSRVSEVESEYVNSLRT